MRHLDLPKVYPLTCGRNHPQLARSFLKAGARLLQVRAKHFSDGELFEQLLEIRQLCHQAGARFVVNDRVDLALAVGAGGVHLGQADLPVEVARGLLGTDAIIGLSTHTRDQFEAAQDLEVDYVAVGPVFATSSKRSPYPELGPETVAAWVPRSRHPVVAIGGITLERACLLWRAGASSVAVISDLADSPDPERRLAQYLERAAALER